MSNTVNACGFFIRNDSGKVTDAGIITFKRIVTSSGTKIEATVRINKDENVAPFLASIPPGGYGVTDKMSGRIELVFSTMDDSIPFRAVTDIIDVLRDRFNLPLTPECQAEVKELESAQSIIPVKPNPTRS